MHNEAAKIISHFNLKPHPEGGYFKETYRCKDFIPNDILTENFEGDRNVSTSIYFLLTSDSFSAYHKINQDEIWHFYNGTSIKLHLISPQGKYSSVLIGSHFEKGEQPQFTVPGQYYFAAEVLSEDSYAFVGCTVAPGFDFRDFVLPSQTELIAQYPNLKENIIKFTRN